MSSRKSKSNIKNRARRATSNVFAMFDQAQIQEFKEAFNMIDQDRDGFISKEDLHDTLASMGKNPSDAYLEEMINEATGPINFTMFLTMFGDKLNGTDPETVILNAFACFEESGLMAAANADGTGHIPEDKLRDLLMTIGDRFTEEECEELLRDAPVKNGSFDYVEFTRILKHGRKEDDSAQTL